MNSKSSMKAVKNCTENISPSRFLCGGVSIGALRFEFFCKNFHLKLAKKYSYSCYLRPKIEQSCVQCYEKDIVYNRRPKSIQDN